MKTFRTLLLSFAAMLLCVACGQKQPAPASSEIKPKGPIHIQLPESHEYKNTLPFTLADIATDIRYIPLETTPDCLIARECTPKFTKDYIFIASQGILLQFDRQGKFLRRINVLGKGPENCTVRSYGIDEKNRLIHILDMIYHNIHTFSFDGQHIKTLRNPFAGVPDLYDPDEFVYDQEKGNLIFIGFEDGKGNEPYKYVVIDTAGTILNKSPNYAQYHLRAPGLRLTSSMVVGGDGSTRLYRYDSSYYYHYGYNDTIFVINKDYTCSPVYISHLPNRKTIEENVKAMNGVIKREDLYGRNALGGCREDERYVYLYHGLMLSREEGIGLLSLYEKATGTLIENINSLTPLLNDWDGGMDVPLYAYNPGEHQNYLMLDPYKMKETLTEEYFAGRDIAHPDKAEALKKLVATLKDGDNPVLMIITLK